MIRYFSAQFRKAGCGKLTNGGYWIDESHSTFLQTYNGYILYRYCQIYGAGNLEFPLPYLLKIDWLDDDAISNDLSATDGCAAIQAHEKYICLFDGLTSSKWCTYKDYKKKGINGKDDVWFVDFQTNAPVIPTGYKMTTGNECSQYKGRNPKAWKLYGRGDIGDNWVLLAEVANGGMADVNCKTYSYNIAGHDWYMYFRLEISSCESGSTMQLAELSLITMEPEDDE